MRKIYYLMRLPPEDKPIWVALKRKYLIPGPVLLRACLLFALEQEKEFTEALSRYVVAEDKNKLGGT